MSFLKSLKIRKSKKGQAAIEYFVLFAVIAGLTIVSLGSGMDFLGKVRRTLQGDPSGIPQGFFGRAAKSIIYTR
jgi:Flp pilus assembly pilin Flp